jgi:hypothetical protein
MVPDRAILIKDQQEISAWSGRDPRLLPRGIQNLDA